MILFSEFHSHRALTICVAPAAHRGRGDIVCTLSEFVVSQGRLALSQILIAIVSVSAFHMGLVYLLGLNKLGRSAPPERVPQGNWVEPTFPPVPLFPKCLTGHGLRRSMSVPSHAEGVTATARHILRVSGQAETHEGWETVLWTG